MKFEFKEIKIKKGTHLKDLDRGTIAVVKLKKRTELLFIYGLSDRPKKAISLSNPNFYLINISENNSEVIEASRICPDKKDDSGKGKDDSGKGKDDSGKGKDDSGKE